MSLRLTTRHEIKKIYKNFPVKKQPLLFKPDHKIMLFPHHLRSGLKQPTTYIPDNRTRVSYLMFLLLAEIMLSFD